MMKSLESIMRVHTHTHTHTHTRIFKELVKNTRFFVMSKNIN